MGKSFYEQVGVAMTCRDFGEYCAMFDLSDEMLGKGAILDVAGGGSSFIAEARERGFEAYAADPRYDGDTGRWIEEAEGEIATSTAKLNAIKEQLDWSYYGSLDNHRRGREMSLSRFANHAGTIEGARCYVNASLPVVPFEDNAFSLVLCSHFLFLYAEQFGYKFHADSIRELMRVCKPGGDILIYPIFSLRWEPYAHLEELMDLVRTLGGVPGLRESRLPFIPGSTLMLQITIDS